MIGCNWTTWPLLSFDVVRALRFSICAAASTVGRPQLSGPNWMLVHDGPLVHLNDVFRCRWAVTQSAVWSFGVVVLSPFFDQDLCFAQAVEDFAVQELIPEPGIEAFTISIIPR